MRVHYKSGLLASLLALALAGITGPVVAADDHSSHDSGHSSGGKGKGPKYGGGRDHGSSHSDQTHEEAATPDTPVGPAAARPWKARCSTVAAAKARSTWAARPGMRSHPTTPTTKSTSIDASSVLFK